MISPSNNMRGVNRNPLGETLLSREFEQFWGAVRPGADPFEEKLETIIYDVRVALRDCAEQTLRRQGAPNAELDAEDVAQSWIANMLGPRARHFDRKRGSFGYSIRALKNRCRDVWRDIQRRKAIDLPAWCMASIDEACTQAVRRERRAQVRKEVRRLPKAMRRIVKAKYWFGLKSKEIASLLNIKVAAVNRLAFLGRRRLREALRD